MKITKMWYERKVKLLEIDKMLTTLMREFANTPLDKRKTGWDWLIKARDKLKILKDNE